MTSYNNSKHKYSNSKRILKIASQIKKDLSFFINKEIGNKYGIITITDIELTVDYAYAKVYFTVFGCDIKIVSDILNKKAGLMHSYIYKILHIHNVPSLEFIHDDSIEYGMKISNLIKEANNIKD